MEPDYHYKKHPHNPQRYEKRRGDMTRKGFARGFEIVHRYRIGDANCYKRRYEIDGVEIYIECAKFTGANIMCK